jgi:S1-C subfamily serine protease
VVALWRVHYQVHRRSESRSCTVWRLFRECFQWAPLRGPSWASEGPADVLASVPVAYNAGWVSVTWALVSAHLVVACGAGRGTIGAMLARRPTGELAVHQVPEGLAARDAGVRPGDQILLIDGKDVRALDPDQLHQALSGEVGEPVKLTLIRGDRVVRVTLKRTPARQRPSPTP